MGNLPGSLKQAGENFVSNVSNIADKAKSFGHYITGGFADPEIPDFVTRQILSDASKTVTCIHNLQLSNREAVAKNADAIKDYMDGWKGLKYRRYREPSEKEYAYSLISIEIIMYYRRQANDEYFPNVSLSWEKLRTSPTGDAKDTYNDPAVRKDVDRVVKRNISNLEQDE